MKSPPIKKNKSPGCNKIEENQRDPNLAVTLLSCSQGDKIILNTLP